MARVVFLVGLFGLTGWRLGHDPSASQAREAYRAGQPVEALRHAFDSLARHPRATETHRIAARNLSRLLYSEEAEPHYELLRSRGAFDAADAHERALGLLRSNRREAAARAYEAMLADAPRDSLALQRFAALQWSRGLGDEALGLAARLAELPEGAITGHTLLAEILHDKGDRERALAHFRRVLELDPELTRLVQPKLIFLSEFADDLIRLGLPSEARALLEPVALEIDDSLMLDLLARACLDEGDRPAAELWIQRSIKRDGSRVFPWLFLGRLMIQTRKPGEALAAVGRALEIAPEHYEALTLAATAERLLGRAEEARRHQMLADRVRRRAPTPPGGMGADALPSKP